MNKLQSSVEVEESVWKKKVEEAYLEATEANKNAESLQKEIEVGGYKTTFFLFQTELLNGSLTTQDFQVTDFYNSISYINYDFLFRNYKVTIPHIKKS